jgi:hypothetical protein
METLIRYIFYKLSVKSVSSVREKMLQFASFDITKKDERRCLCFLLAL